MTDVCTLLHSVILANCKGCNAASPPSNQDRYLTGMRMVSCWSILTLPGVSICNSFPTTGHSMPVQCAFLERAGNNNIGGKYVKFQNPI